ncbi:MAG: hypothetical protein M1831_003894 [Alyxoria varia]|nr:MAG: hypothetical protein M1831_003894 [Alyxoria varia]
MQEKFRSVIHEFPHVISTTQKLLRAAPILEMPIFVTTQQRAKLGETCSELEIGTKYKPYADVDKSAFSMYVPDIETALRTRSDQNKRASLDICIVGIETHICVLQTALDALANGFRVWVVQDGVSSCNAQERGIALARLRQEGARITTSESLLFETLGDAKNPA